MEIVLSTLVFWVSFQDQVSQEMPLVSGVQQLNGIIMPENKEITYYRERYYSAPPSHDVHLPGIDQTPEQRIGESFQRMETLSDSKTVLVWLLTGAVIVCLICIGVLLRQNARMRRCLPQVLHYKPREP